MNLAITQHSKVLGIKACFRSINTPMPTGSGYASPPHPHAFYTPASIEYLNLIWVLDLAQHFAFMHFIGTAAPWVSYTVRAKACRNLAVVR